MKIEQGILLAVVLVASVAASLTNSKFKNADFSGYITLGGTTNQVTDNGAALTYNGQALAQTNSAALTVTNGLRTGITILSGTTPTLSGTQGPRFDLELTGVTTVTLADLLTEAGMQRKLELWVTGNGTHTLAFGGQALQWHGSLIGRPRAGSPTLYLFDCSAARVDAWALDDGAVIIGGYTQAEKSAMTPANGMLIYQTDNTPGLRAYVNGMWYLVSLAADP
jgi:hypothetical protein